jgi:hypothetical protein
MEQDIPKLILDQYEQYQTKVLTFRHMSRKHYDAMINQFKKYGLYQPKSTTGVIFPSDISKEEHLHRQRAYMKIWRANHPGYNWKHMQNFKTRTYV